MYIAKAAQSSNQQIQYNLMDEIETRDLSSSSDSEEEKPSSIKGKTVYRLFGRERPLHMVLGGGKRTFPILYFILFICCFDN